MCIFKQEYRNETGEFCSTRFLLTPPVVALIFGNVPLKRK